MQSYTPTTLRASDYETEYPSLEDDLKDQAISLIKASDILMPWHDIASELADSISYSLSYSQGDGVCFTGGSIDGYYIARTGFSSYYLHENTFLVDHDDDGTKKQADIYTDELRDICKKLEAYGYTLIDQADIESIKFQAFERFKSNNGIESDTGYYDFVESKENGTLIATSGDTSLDDFYLVLPETITLTREVGYKVFA